MDAKRERNVGLSVLAVGLTTMVLSVLLVGLTTDSGAADWVRIVTAVAGTVMAVAGLFMFSRNNGTSGTPHTTS
jgi:succinate-acetate transporter protein